MNSYHKTILFFVLCCLNENVLPVYVGERKSVFQITKMIAVAMQKKKKDFQEKKGHSFTCTLVEIHSFISQTV